jgi:hypothetical protein
MKPKKYVLFRGIKKIQKLNEAELFLLSWKNLVWLEKDEPDAYRAKSAIP